MGMKKTRFKEIMSEQKIESIPNQQLTFDFDVYRAIIVSIIFANHCSFIAELNFS